MKNLDTHAGRFYVGINIYLANKMHLEVNFSFPLFERTEIPSIDKGPCTNDVCTGEGTILKEDVLVREVA